MYCSFREGAAYRAEEVDDYETDTEARYSSLKFCQILVEDFLSIYEWIARGVVSQGPQL